MGRGRQCRVGAGRREGRRREDGLTLVELVTGMTLMALTLLVTGLALQAGMRATRETGDLQLVQARANSYMNAILSQNFGLSTDPLPSAVQLDELFDGDLDSGTVTVTQLGMGAGATTGWCFTLADFPVEGEWCVIVDRDLDDDGVILGDLETGGNVFRIRIFFDGQLVAQSDRAKEVTL